VLLTGAAAAYSYFHVPRTERLTDKDTIVLADIENTTGDAVFDGALRQGLAVLLQQSPFLSLVSDERIQRTLRLMGRPPDARLTPALARDVCERTASAVVLDGSIAKLGSQFVLGLRATNCRTGDVLDRQQSQAPTKEAVLEVLSQIAGKFRIRVGESLSTVEKHNIAFTEATTASLDAWKAYSAANMVNYSAGTAAAIPLFRRAIELDADFAMAHARLGLSYSIAGESVLAAASTGRAYELRDRTSDREQFFITANYERQVKGNLEKAQQVMESWAQTYPRDVVPHGLVAGFISQGTARYEGAIVHAARAAELEPDEVFAYANLAANYIYLDRLAEAQSALRIASERKLDIIGLAFLRYHLAFLNGDTAAMERQADVVKGKPGDDGLIAHLQALVLARSGRLQQSRIGSRQAVDAAQRAGHRERAAGFEAAVAVREALFGNALDARRHARAALEVSQGRDVEYAAGFALAHAGDSQEPEALANDLERRYPEDTSARVTYVPMLRALAALNRKEPATAIERLQVTGPYDLAVTGINFVAFFGGLYPVYARGEAFLALQQGAAAAGEFQKILDHRGIVGADPLGALAHLQLGRAFVLSGDKPKAMAAYQAFLTLWKDADADIPVFKQAQAEFASLQSSR
jgi:tetratricopeptide (TPR) repeat protein